MSTKACPVTITDENGNIVKIFNSKTSCGKTLGITRYKIEQYSENHVLFNGYYLHTSSNIEKFVEVECECCDTPFKCEKFRVEKAEHVYCSIKCRDEALNGEKNCICPICQTPFHIKPYHLNKYKEHYCSRKCLTKSKEISMLGENNHQYGLKGSLNASWKSDERITEYGYKSIRMIGHPFATSADFVLEHRLVAEKYLLNEENSVVIDGVRYLSPDFVVHHIDFNRLNNDINNLVVMRRGDHTALHKRIQSNSEEFKLYCKQYNLDFETTYNQHIYNMEHYSYDAIRNK